MTEKEMTDIQCSLSERLTLTDRLPAHSIKTVSGVDLAYWEKNGGEYAVCCIVTMDIDSRQVLESRSYSGRIAVPYIPGFLAFRELPLVLETVKMLEYPPDIFMFDGNGYLHPRHMGIASHASFYLDKPCIGVAKTYFKVGDGEYVPPGEKAGDRRDITVGSIVYGCALRTADNVRPVFVSPGNFISLDSAVKIVMKCIGSEGHIPIPTRLADIMTREQRKLITGS